MRMTLDVFPALVWLAPPGSLSELSLLSTSGKSPEGTRKLDRCRVVVMNNSLMIAIDSPEGPKLVFKEAVVSRQTEGQMNRVKTETGKIIAFSKDHNCGCGSRLRTWNPYGNVLMSNMDPQ